jgi:hypothetical protein
MKSKQAVRKARLATHPHLEPVRRWVCSRGHVHLRKPEDGICMEEVWRNSVDGGLPCCQQVRLLSPAKKRKAAK